VKKSSKPHKKSDIAHIKANLTQHKRHKKAHKNRNMHKSTSPASKHKNKLPILVNNLNISMLSPHNFNNFQAKNELNRDLSKNHFKKFITRYRGRKISEHLESMQPPSSMKIPLSKRRTNKSVLAEMKKSRVNFIPATQSHIPKKEMTKFERTNRNEKRIMQSFELLKSSSKSKIQSLISQLNQLDPNYAAEDNSIFRNPVELSQARKGLKAQFDYRMFIEDHLHDNLMTTFSLIRHLEDMGVKKSSFEYYKYQRSALDEQKSLAEEAKKEHRSGKTDPSLGFRQDDFSKIS
jgi:hypothetical protein